MWAFEQLNGYVEELPETIDGLYGRVFAQLELKYGEALTQRALVMLCSRGSLRFSAHGAKRTADGGTGSEQKHAAGADGAEPQQRSIVHEQFVQELKELLRVHEASDVVACECHLLSAAIQNRYGKRREEGRDRHGDGNGDGEEEVLVLDVRGSGESEADDAEYREERNILSMLDGYERGDGEGDSMQGDGSAQHIDRDGDMRSTRTGVFEQVLAVTRNHRDREQERQRKEQEDRRAQMHDAKIVIVEGAIKAGCAILHEVLPAMCQPTSVSLSACLSVPWLGCDGIVVTCATVTCAGMASAGLCIQHIQTYHHHCHHIVDQQSRASV
jgi:hypothetical protein